MIPLIHNVQLSSRNIYIYNTRFRIKERERENGELPLSSASFLFREQGDECPQDRRVNLSNLNAKPLRFLMADKSVSLSQSGRILWETSETREGRRKRDFFVASNDK